MLDGSSASDLVFRPSSARPATRRNVKTVRLTSVRNEKYNRTSPLMTTEDVARRLSLATASVRRMVRDGVLPAIRINERHYRFDPGEVDAWIATRRKRQA
jgi:excisionase family DNA binding protein